MNILVTGANGFIGTPLCHALKQAGHRVIECVRVASSPSHHAVGELADFTEWDSLMQGVEVVIHLAARVHQVKDTATHPDTAFHRTNVEVTQQLLRAAERAGVQHFIFFSSIAVMGVNSGDTPMPATTLHPTTLYGRSKAQAEDIVQKSSIPSTIIRIPLVYGVSVRANFLSLIKAVDKGLPLPFGSVRNARNFLYVRNLVDAMLKIIERHAYSPDSHVHGNDVLLLADRETPSMPDLIRAIADALGTKPRLMPVPPALLKVGASMMGKTSLYHQCCSSLVMDTAPTNALLTWQPPYSLQEGLAETIAWYRASSHG